MTHAPQKTKRDSVRKSHDRKPPVGGAYASNPHIPCQVFFTTPRQTSIVDTLMANVSEGWLGVQERNSPVRLWGGGHGERHRGGDLNIEELQETPAGRAGSPDRLDLAGDRRDCRGPGSDGHHPEVLRGHEAGLAGEVLLGKRPLGFVALQDKADPIGPDGKEACEFHRIVSEGRVGDHHPVAYEPLEDHEMLIAPDLHRDDDRLVQIYQEVKVHLVPDRLVAPRLGEPLHIQQREGPALDDLFYIGPLGHPKDDLLLGRRVPEIVGEQRRDDGRPAAIVVLLKGDVAGLQLSKGGDIIFGHAKPAGIQRDLRSGGDVVQYWNEKKGNKKPRHFSEYRHPHLVSNRTHIRRSQMRPKRFRICLTTPKRMLTTESTMTPPFAVTVRMLPVPVPVAVPKVTLTGGTPVEPPLPGVIEPLKTTFDPGFPEVLEVPFGSALEPVESETAPPRNPTVAPEPGLLDRKS